MSAAEPLSTIEWCRREKNRLCRDEWWHKQGGVEHGSNTSSACTHHKLTLAQQRRRKKAGPLGTMCSAAQAGWSGAWLEHFTCLLPPQLEVESRWCTNKKKETNSSLVRLHSPAALATNALLCSLLPDPTSAHKEKEDGPPHVGYGGHTLNIPFPLTCSTSPRVSTPGY